MCRAAFYELPQERRRALLDVAGRHFAAHGWKGASLNALLAEAGVSKGVAYYYFEDKADLFATLLEEAWADIAPLAPQPGEALWPALHRMYRAHLDILRTRPWLAELNRQPPPPEVLARLAPIGAALHGIWEMVQAEGLRQDLPPALVAEMVQGLDGAIDRWWASHPEATVAEADAAFDTLRALILGRAT